MSSDPTLLRQCSVTFVGLLGGKKKQIHPFWKGNVSFFVSAAVSHCPCLLKRCFYLSLVVILSKPSVAEIKKKGPSSPRQESLNLFFFFSPFRDHVYTLMSPSRFRTFLWTPPPSTPSVPTSSPPVMWVSSEQSSQPASPRVRDQSETPISPTATHCWCCRASEREREGSGAHQLPHTSSQPRPEPWAPWATVSHCVSFQKPSHSYGGWRGGGGAAGEGDGEG